jgi:hypothetical protein
VAEEDGTPADQGLAIVDNGMNSSFDQSQDQPQDGLSLGAPALSQGDSLQLVQPSPVSGIQTNALNGNINQCNLVNETL